MKKYTLFVSILGLCASAHSQDVSIQGNIIIQSGSTLAIEGNFAHVSGSIHNAGTLKFQSAAAKNLDGNNQKYMGTLEFNGGTTTLTGKVRIPGGINPGTIVISGTGVLNTGNKLSLIADSFATGRIAEITSSATKPLVSFEDSIVIVTTSGYKSFRFFGNPFYTQLPLTQFSDGPLEIDITGPGGTTSGFSVNTINNNPSAFKYSESANTWVGYTKGTDSIPVGFGASIYVMNRKGQTLLNGGAAFPDSAKIALAGGLRSGNVTTSLANTGAGWNLIANPYPSNINISSTSISSGWNNVQASVHTYDKKNKSFISHNRSNGASSGKMTSVIPMGGAFLVQADGAVNSVATITFSESMKTASAASSVATNPFFLNIDSLKNRFGITIKNDNINGNKEEDQCVLLFANDKTATDNYDSKFDAVDLKSEVVNIGVFSKDNTKLSISSYPNQIEKYLNTPFPLTVWAKDTGSYSIYFTCIAKMDSNMEIWLKDNYLNKIQKIEAQYYPFKITNNSQTMGDKRFELFPIKKEGVDNDKIQKSSIRFVPNPVNNNDNFMVLFPENVIGTINVQIFELTGKLILHSKNELQGGLSNSLVLKTDNLSPNIYIVMVSTNQGVFSNKLIVTQQ